MTSNTAVMAIALAVVIAIVGCTATPSDSSLGVEIPPPQSEVVVVVGTPRPLSRAPSGLIGIEFEVHNLGPSTVTPTFVHGSVKGVVYEGYAGGPLASGERRELKLSASMGHPDRFTTGAWLPATERVSRVNATIRFDHAPPVEVEAIAVCAADVVQVADIRWTDAGVQGFNVTIAATGNCPPVLEAIRWNVPGGSGHALAEFGRFGERVHLDVGESRRLTVRADDDFKLPHPLNESSTTLRVQAVGEYGPNLGESESVMPAGDLTITDATTRWACSTLDCHLSELRITTRSDGERPSFVGMVGLYLDGKRGAEPWALAAYGPHSTEVVVVKPPWLFEKRRVAELRVEFFAPDGSPVAAWSGQTVIG